MWRDRRCITSRVMRVLSSVWAMRSSVRTSSSETGISREGAILFQWRGGWRSGEERDTQGWMVVCMMEPRSQKIIPLSVRGTSIIRCSIDKGGSSSSLIPHYPIIPFITIDLTMKIEMDLNSKYRYSNEFKHDKNDEHCLHPYRAICLDPFNPWVLSYLRWKSGKRGGVHGGERFWA